MKKVFSILCATLLFGVAAFQFASCTKVDDNNPPRITELRFDIKVNNASAPDTKAVKTDWADGDQIYVFFKVGDAYLDAIKYVTLTYVAADDEWTGALSGDLTDATDLGSAGTMYGIHFPFGGVSIASDGADGVTFLGADGRPIYTYYLSGNAAYTVETAGDVATLTGTFDLTMPDDYVYFFIDKSGDQYGSSNKYRLSVEGLKPAACTGFSAGSFTETELAARRQVWGYAYGTDGIAFSGKIDATWSASNSHTFLLFNEDDPTVLSKSITASLASHASVKLKDPSNSSNGWTKCGFRGYEISKGFLIRNNNGTYSLTPGTDPFEIYNYYGINDNKNKVYFQFSFLKSDDELGASGDNINATSAKLPTGWIFPSASSDNSDWYKIIRSATSSKISIQNTDDSITNVTTGYYGKDQCFAFVVVTKDENTYFGMVLFRDGTYIPKECGIQHWGKGSAINNITYEQLQALIDAGCFFFSSTGGWFNGSWRYINNNSNVEGNYMSSSYASSKWYRMQITNYSSPSVSTSTGTNSSPYIPVRLVKKF